MFTIPFPLWFSNITSQGGGGELHILTFNWSLHTFVHNSQNTVSSQILNKLSNSYLVIQIAITFISDNILDCNVHEASIIQLMTICILPA